MALERLVDRGRDLEVRFGRAEERLDAAVDQPALMQAVEDIALVQLHHERAPAAQTLHRLGIERLGGDHVVAHDLGAGRGQDGDGSGIGVGADHELARTHLPAACKADESPAGHPLYRCHRRVLADSGTQRHRVRRKGPHQAIGMHGEGRQLQGRLAAALRVRTQAIADTSVRQRLGHFGDTARGKAAHGLELQLAGPDLAVGQGLVEPGAERVHLGVEGVCGPGVIGVGFCGQQPDGRRQG